MGSFFGEDFVRRVRDMNDIVDVVNSYVPLKRAGRTFRALCPFHGEKTPSFHVNPEKQIFHCFGCGVGGDVISFVKLIERVEFPEAVELLAERCALDIPKQTQNKAQHQKQKSFKSLLYRLHKFAAEFYHKHLFTDEGRAALDYVKGRGISLDMIKKFRLGYAPEGGSVFVKAAKNKNASYELLIKAGLAVERMGGEVRDRFRNRLIFPIHDNKDNCVGFGGRCLSPKDEPKYLNSPETPLFSKSNLLYGLNFAKESFTPGEKPRRLIITEGYTDTIMMVQHGIKNAIATLGTALTKQHISILRRYADEAILLFDSDNAGQKATARSLDLFIEEDYPARVAIISGEKDPCDFLVEHGADAMRIELEKSKELIEYKLDSTIAGAVNDVNAKATAIRDAMRLIGKIPGPIKRDLWINNAADKLNVSEKALREELRHHSKFDREHSPVQANKTALPEVDKSEKMVIAILCKFPELIPAFGEEIEKIGIQTPILYNLWKKMLLLFDKRNTIISTDLLDGIDDDTEASLIVGILEEELGPKGNTVAAAKTLLKGALQSMARRMDTGIDELHKKIQKAETVGNNEEIMRLLAEKQDIVRRKHKTKNN